MTTTAPTKMPETMPPPALPERRATSWIQHLRNHIKEHGGTWKEAMKNAKSTHQKAPAKEKTTGARKSNPWMDHVAKWRADNPDWKDKYSYKDVLQLCKATYRKATPEAVAE